MGLMVAGWMIVILHFNLHSGISLLLSNIWIPYISVYQGLTNQVFLLLNPTAAAKLINYFQHSNAFPVAGGKCLWICVRRPNRIFTLHSIEYTKSTLDALVSYSLTYSNIDHWTSTLRPGYIRPSHIQFSMRICLLEQQVFFPYLLWIWVVCSIIKGNWNLQKYDSLDQSQFKMPLWDKKLD